MLSQLQIIAADGPNGWFVPSDPKEMWWAIAAFSIIALLLVTKGLKPLMAALEKAQDAAVADATAAEAAIAESQAKIAAATADLGDVNAETERIIADAHETAKQLRIDSVTRGQQLVDDMWAKAQADVESMKVQAHADIQAEVAAQAVGAAEHVVHNNLDAAGQSDLIESYITNLGAST